MTKLHTCKTPSTFFMKNVKSEEWQCDNCGKKWIWGKTGFGGTDDYGWHLLIGRKDTD